MKRKINHNIASALLVLPSMIFCPFLAMAADKAPLKTAANETVTALPEMEVTEKFESEDGRRERPSKTDLATPKVKVLKRDIERLNTVTTADSIKYESGVFTRQRYIGDPNAPVGMRSTNPYQAARVIVNMDGMPIWNPLQSSYNGSPRWGLIGSNEIKSIDVLSGAFSAEYSGNAIGGVMNFNTLMPQKREVYVEGTYMLQPYNTMGSNTNLQGFKTFGSYGDKFGDFSTYFAYTHLENEGQPMTPTVQTTLNRASTAQLNNATTGALSEQNPKGNGIGGPAGAPMLQVGTDGMYHSTDNLFKWKGGYDLRPDLLTTLTLAYEMLEVDHTGTSLIKNAAGQTVWGSQLSNYSANGYALTNSTALGTSDQNRETFTAGWGLNGRIGGNWYTNTNISVFNIIKDQTISSSYNPNDPAFKTAAGQTGTNTTWNGSGWFNLSMKFNNEEFLGRKDLSFATGYEFQHAHMLQTVNNLSNFSNLTVSTTTPLSTQSGGTLDTHALFGQMSWRFIKDWDATFGTRIERWNMSGGTYLTAANLTGSLNPQDRQVSAWSPKFSIGFQPGRWKFRYSVGKAYRFPVADELFGNSASVNGSVQLANSTLKPEDATQHNLLMEYDFDNGYVRLNLFHDNIRNEIYTQYIYLNGSNQLSSIMSSVGETETNGLDLSASFDRVLSSPIDVKFNTTILNKEIIANPLNTAVVGNQFPLMPHYRVNVLTTYNITNDWAFSVGTRYQSAMNSQVDNQDLQLAYYGAFTASTYVDLKTTYQFNNKKGHVSLGVNNVNDCQAFFNHPLPLRSYFLQVGYKF